MRDILEGGILTTCSAITTRARPKTFSRRRSVAQSRVAVRSAPAATAPVVQPGQLASPLLRFGFPSLALH